MKDSVFQSAPFPGYSTKQLEQFVAAAKVDGFFDGDRRYQDMQAEIDRRAKLTASDTVAEPAKTMAKVAARKAATPKRKAIYMPDYIKEQCDLAHIYAEDGAYQAAARILRKVATVVTAHAENLKAAGL